MQMGIHNSVIQRCVQRISSGQRINSAADDPAGLYISEQMRGQMGALKVSIRDSQLSLLELKTQEGHLIVQQETVQQMRELALRASNGTLTAQDRKLLNTEFQELKKEIIRVNQSSLSRGGSAVKPTVPEGGIDAQQSELEELELDLEDLELELELDLEDEELLLLPEESAEPEEPAQAEEEEEDAAQQAASPVQSDGVVFETGLQALEIANPMAVQVMTSFEDLDLLTVEGAREALDVLDHKLKQLSSQRASIGAQINALETRISAMETELLNITESESRIRDADIAAEMTLFAKTMVLQQVAQAMLTHSIHAMPDVLDLLR